LNNQRRTADRGLSCSFRVRRGAKNPSQYKKVTKGYTEPRNWQDFVNTVMNFQVP